MLVWLRTQSWDGTPGRTWIDLTGVMELTKDMDKLVTVVTKLSTTFHSLLIYIHSDCGHSSICLDDTEVRRQTLTCERWTRYRSLRTALLNSYTAQTLYNWIEYPCVAECRCSARCDQKITAFSEILGILEIFEIDTFLTYLLTLRLHCRKSGPLITIIFQPEYVKITCCIQTTATDLSGYLSQHYTIDQANRPT